MNSSNNQSVVAVEDPKSVKTDANGVDSNASATAPASAVIVTPAEGSSVPVVQVIMGKPAQAEPPKKFYTFENPAAKAVYDSMDKESNFRAADHLPPHVLFRLVEAKAKWLKVSQKEVWTRDDAGKWICHAALTEEEVRSLILVVESGECVVCQKPVKLYGIVEISKELVAETEKAGTVTIPTGTTVWKYGQSCLLMHIEGRPQIVWGCGSVKDPSSHISALQRQNPVTDRNGDPVTDGGKTKLHPVLGYDQAEELLQKMEQNHSEKVQRRNLSDQAAANAIAHLVGRTAANGVHMKAVGTWEPGQDGGGNHHERRGQKRRENAWKKNHRDDSR